MSIRWRLAQTIRKRIQSISDDADKLAEAIPEFEASLEMRHSLNAAFSWAMEVENRLAGMGEAEDDEGVQDPEGLPTKA